MYERFYNVFDNTELTKFGATNEKVLHKIHENELILEKNNDIDIYLYVSELIKGQIYPSM